MGVLRILTDYVGLKWRARYWNEKKIRAFQLKEIKRLMAYAQKKSPFYADLYKDLYVDTFDDFMALPSVNKTVMMAHFTDFNTCGLVKDAVFKHAIEAEKNKDYLGYYQDQYVIGLSSGTSGNKGIFITPKKLTKRLPGVFLARGGLGMSALPLRIVFLLRVFSQGFEDINAPGIKLKYLSTMTDPETILATMNTLNTNVLMAPPSLIRFLLPIKDKLTSKLKKIITYAEVLNEEDKRQFEEAFKTKVVEIYQASEGQMASPCRLGHLHINEDLVHIEIYDASGNLVDKPHVEGHRMYVTNLVNKAQPIIRYEMNDMIVLDEPCPCKSSFRRIKKVLGRHDDLLYFFDKAKHVKVVFPDLFARWIITETPAIREFQVIQNRHGEVLVNVDLTTPYPLEALQTRLEQELNAMALYGSVKVEETKLELPKDKNKYKRFIQKTPKT